MIDTRAGWMQTYSGIAFEPFNPRAADICIEDIAHSLALQCRFAGHCRFPYSVAQHSVLVSKTVPAEFAFVGLMHDAAEAYVVDLPRPIKSHADLARYRAIEDHVWRALCVRFGLPLQLPEEVKMADNIVLATEKRDIMTAPPREWLPLPEPRNDRIEYWPWENAKASFLEAFALLRRKL